MTCIDPNPAHPSTVCHVLPLPYVDVRPFNAAQASFRIKEDRLNVIFQERRRNTEDSDTSSRKWRRTSEPVENTPSVDKEELRISHAIRVIL